jgi:Predicted transcriptional regulators
MYKIMEKDTKPTPLTNLKKLRQQSGETLKQLSNDTGISYSALSAYERGARKPKYEQLERLAKHFKVTVSYLQGFVDTPEKVTTDVDKTYLTKLGLETLDRYMSVEDEMISNRVRALYDLTFGVGASDSAPELENVDLSEIGHIVDNIFTALLVYNPANKELDPKLFDPKMYKLIKEFSYLISFGPSEIDLQLTYDKAKVREIQNQLLKPTKE